MLKWVEWDCSLFKTWTCLFLSRSPYFPGREFTTLLSESEAFCTARASAHHLLLLTRHEAAAEGQGRLGRSEPLDFFFLFWPQQAQRYIRAMGMAWAGIESWPHHFAIDLGQKYLSISEPQLFQLFKGGDDTCPKGCDRRRAGKWLIIGSLEENPDL